ncbi:MAG: hypothetical protein M9891_04395 [Austwickia sp.]|nr:hypothetical protein [Actinomycetota bacterium]MCB1251735.1 hypothetical protein [Austwickia sp.]MCO5308524.1 hypothetical protein [Austwickia sp.]
MPANLFGGLRLRGTIVVVDPERDRTVSLALSNAFARGTVQLLLLPLRAFVFVIGMLIPPLRALIGTSLIGMAGRGALGGEQLIVRETAFRLRDTAGDQHDCLLRGELRGGALRLGDQVDVRGSRALRGREIQVSQVTNIVTGTVTTGHLPAKARHSAVVTVLQAVVFMVVAYTLLRSCGAI